MSPTSLVRVLLLAVTMLTAGPVHATMTDYQRQQITRYLHGPKATLNTGIFEPLIPGDTLRGTIDASDNHKLDWVGYRVGAPERGTYRLVLNSDDLAFGGSEHAAPECVEATDEPWHDFPFSFVIDLPPLAALVLVPDAS